MEDLNPNTFQIDMFFFLFCDISQFYQVKEHISVLGFGPGAVLGYGTGAVLDLGQVQC